LWGFVVFCSHRVRLFLAGRLVFHGSVGLILIRLYTCSLFGVDDILSSPVFFLMNSGLIPSCPGALHGLPCFIALKSSSMVMSPSSAMCPADGFVFNQQFMFHSLFVCTLSYFRLMFCKYLSVCIIHLMYLRCTCRFRNFRWRRDVSSPIMRF